MFRYHNHGGSATTAPTGINLNNPATELSSKHFKWPASLSIMLPLSLMLTWKRCEERESMGGAGGGAGVFDFI